MNQAIVSATFILLPTIEICACSAPHNSVADQVQLIVCSNGIGTPRISINGSGISVNGCIFDNQHIFRSFSLRSICCKSISFNTPALTNVE